MPTVDAGLDAGAVRENVGDVDDDDAEEACRACLQVDGSGWRRVVMTGPILGNLERDV